MADMGAKGARFRCHRSKAEGLSAEPERYSLLALIHSAFVHAKDCRAVIPFSHAWRVQRDCGLRTTGTPVTVVPRGVEFDDNILFAQENTAASALVLDRNGVLIASVVDTGLQVKGATEGGARKVARRLIQIMANEFSVVSGKDRSSRDF